MRVMWPPERPEPERVGCLAVVRGGEARQRREFLVGQAEFNAVCGTFARA